MLPDSAVKARRALSPARKTLRENLLDKNWVTHHLILGVLIQKAGIDVLHATALLPSQM